MAPDLYRLTGAVRDYAWGSTTAIQQLLGRPVDGRPMAELWFGAHADDSATVAGTATTLRELIDADPVRLLGPAEIDRFGAELPFLVKVLAAERALSIQVHPTLAQARAGFAAEDARGVPRDASDRNYRDANHKPELLCALTEFDALCGFRPVEQTLRVLAQLDVPALAPIQALLRGPDGLQAAFVAILGFDSVVADAVVAASERLNGEWAELGRELRRVAQDYPGDVGLVLMLLLNLVRLQPGEAIYLGAGNVHAYLRGVGVEVMASSDNVLRCGLTGKHVDVAELLRVADFAPLADPRWPAQPVGGGCQFTVPVPDFSLFTVALGDVSPTVPLPADGAQLVLCTKGSVTVRLGEQALALTAGEACFVAARRTPRLSGAGTAFRVATATP